MKELIEGIKKVLRESELREDQLKVRDSSSNISIKHIPTKGIFSLKFEKTSVRIVFEPVLFSIYAREETIEYSSSYIMWRKISYELNFWISSVLKAPVASEENSKENVFVIHGRNEVVNIQIFQLLESIGLNPMNWNSILELMPEASPYNGAVLNKAFELASVFVVLFTPDDVTYLKEEFLKSKDFDYEKKPMGQSRPNVFFEAGMAFSKVYEQTILVEVGNPKPFTDIVGRHAIKLDNSENSRKQLVQSFEKLGCSLDLESKNDWLKKWDFDLS